MQFASMSDKGCIRKINEDAYYTPTEDGPKNLFIVADGMGGHNAGEYASNFAVNSITDFFKNQKDFDLEINKNIRRAIRSANTKLYNKSIKNIEYKGMGTTITLAYIYGSDMHIAQIGDSRAYLFRDGEIKQITKDHSLVQELYDNGLIAKEEIEGHPKRNVITRAVGSSSRIQIDSYSEKIKAGDRILLCTDGLIRHVLPSELNKIVSSVIEPKICAEELLAICKFRGGSDNITLVLLEISGDEL